MIPDSTSSAFVNDEAIEFPYAPDDDEIIDMWEWQHERTSPRETEVRPHTRRSVWNFMTAMACLLAAAAWLYMRVSQGRDVQGELVAAIAVGLVIWALSSINGMRPGHLREARVQEYCKALKRQPQKFHNIRFRLDRTGVGWTDDDTRVEVAWKAFPAVHERGRVMILERREGDPIYIPLRHLGESVDRALARHKILTWLHEEGGGQRVSIPAMLATRDLPCVSCKYNLRGVSKPACPECGSEIEWRHVREGQIPE